MFENDDLKVECLLISSIQTLQMLKLSSDVLIQVYI